MLELLDSIFKLNSQVEQYTENINKDAESNVSFLLLLIISSSIIGNLISIYGGVTISHSITKPLDQIAGALTAVANEVKELAKQFSSSTDDIRRRVDSILNSTNRVITGIFKVEEVVK